MNLDKNIQWRQLWTEELFLYVTVNHPLAYKKEVTLEELANEAFIMLKSVMHYGIQSMKCSN
ncbi:hypothetical protein CHH69_02025 [Terribacillus saccharophilus]|nr:hypothetical protein CHH69_02025 [Terribacillus saccharophilus]